MKTGNQKLENKSVELGCVWRLFLFYFTSLCWLNCICKFFQTTMARQRTMHFLGKKTMQFSERNYGIFGKKIIEFSGRNYGIFRKKLCNFREGTMDFLTEKNYEIFCKKLWNLWEFSGRNYKLFGKKLIIFSGLNNGIFEKTLWIF